MLAFLDLKNSRKLKARLIEFGFLFVLIAFFYYLANNIKTNINTRHISTGFAFLNSNAGFPIAETPVLPSGLWESGSLFHEYETGSSTYFTALSTGLANTIKACFAAFFIAGTLGIVLGLLQWRGSNSIRKLIAFLFGILRSAPLVLQLIFCYMVILKILPQVSDGLVWFNSIYLNNRGFFFPFWVNGNIEVPTLTFGGRNITGGYSFSPEFLALSFSLGMYSSTYIADIVCSSLKSVAKGQNEAALALGLSKQQSLRYILAPQALTMARPNFINQAVSLVKNSALGVSIGYPELMSVGGTTMNQSGQALEIVIIWMSSYLLINLLLSAINFLFSKKAYGPIEK